MSTHPQRMARALEVANAYRRHNADHGNPFLAGYILLWRLKATAWIDGLNRPDGVRPGVLAVAENGAVWMATGGDYQNGAKEFSSVWEGATESAEATPFDKTANWKEGRLVKLYVGEHTRIRWEVGAEVLIYPIIVGGAYHVQRKHPVDSSTQSNFTLMTNDCFVFTP